MCSIEIGFKTSIQSQRSITCYEAQLRPCHENPSVRSPKWNPMRSTYNCSLDSNLKWSRMPFSSWIVSIRRWVLTIGTSGNKESSSGVLSRRILRIPSMIASSKSDYSDESESDTSDSIDARVGYRWFRAHDVDNVVRLQREPSPTIVQVPSRPFNPCLVHAFVWNFEKFEWATSFSYFFCGGL